MSIIMAPPPFHLILLLMSPGVYSAVGWGVTYSPLHICALKGSTVTINCTFHADFQIKKAYWTKTYNAFADLSEDPKYSERIEYMGYKRDDCSFRLTDVRDTDSHKYYFRFITDQDKWTDGPGVTLEITDLQVESEGETVMEGRSVTLTCESRCSLTDTSTFIWFRNTHTLNERKKKLILPSVRRENAGDYSCAVQGHKLTSPPRRLHVFYPPDKPVISISSSGVIVEGDSVTLTCSSESNPPVHIYSWFKEETCVGSGNIYSISNIRSDHSGQYKCKAKNKHGEKYSKVTLNVLLPHSSYRSLPVGITAVCGGLFIIIIIIIILIFIIKRMQMKSRTRSTAHEYENDGVSNDTYTALDLNTRSFDLYDTLTMAHPEGTRTTPILNSSVYENLPAPVLSSRS